MASFLLTLTPILILYLAWSDAAIWLLVLPLLTTWLGKSLRDGPGWPRWQDGRLRGVESLPTAAIGVGAIYIIAELVEMYFGWF